MSQMSELDLCTRELRNAAQSLTAVADGLVAMFSHGAEEAVVAADVLQTAQPQPTSQEPIVPPEQPTPQELIASEEQAILPPSPSSLTPLTLAQVRAILADKSRDGHTEKVLAMIERHGVTKLSDVDPAVYPDLIKEVEGWTHG